MGASKVALDESSTSNVGVPSFTQARPRQNFAAKLSLAKVSTSQGVRSCSLGGAAEAVLISSLSFSTEKERAHETEVSCGPGSQNVSQPSGKDADNIDRNDPAVCNITKDKQLNTQTSTSQSSQRTSIPGDPLLRL